MNVRQALVLVLGAWIAATVPGMAQPEPAAAGAGIQLYSFQFKDAGLPVVLGRLQALTGKAVVVDPGVQGKFTLATPGPVAADEAVEAIVQALAAQGLRVEGLDADTLRVRAAPAAPKTNP
ncbi:MAG TPA: hypothetical protein PK388_09460 [Kiritimatiellia bacterium]|nr:hypothetical protein [Kiritimatiellia bacterium]